MSSQPAPAQDPFSLERFEHYAYTRQHEPAAREMMKLLVHLDGQYGAFGNLGNAPTGDVGSEVRDSHYATRIASALTAMFSDPNFHLSVTGFQQLILWHRWLAMIFGASPFGNADHIIHLLNLLGHERRDQITLDDKNLLKFCLLYSPDSGIPLQPDALWSKHKGLAASLFIALLSPRIIVSPEAHAKKEMLLGWLPQRLAEVSLDDFPLGIVHDVWMHCSYADRQDKHAVKGAINQLVRNKLLALGFADVPAAPPPPREKPVIMVIVEWFYSNHSIYRTHSLSMIALKEKYRLVGVSLSEATDDITRAVFDEVHLVKKADGLINCLRQVTQLAQQIQPDLVYYPSIGMFLETVFLINLRLAPIQMGALGHPATTHTPNIDYIMVEEDYVGDAACYSEKMVALPKDSIPYRPPANCPQITPEIRDQADPVRVAVAATAMKLNPVFLNTLRRIQVGSKVPVEFHFFTGHAIGLGKIYVQNLVRRFLPERAIVYPHTPYEGYLKNINTCDMFVNPFPFGNTNGIVDTVRQGLPGVCLTGPEVHTHIDQGLFERLGLPGWLVAKTTDEYVQAAVKLAEDQKLRVKLSQQIMKTDPDKVLFQGNPRNFLDAVLWLHQNHGELQTSPERLLKPPVGSRAAKPAASRGTLGLGRLTGKK
jgi:hypothetical protein